MPWSESVYPRNDLSPAESDDTSMRTLRIPSTQNSSNTQTYSSNTNMNIDEFPQTKPLYEGSKPRQIEGYMHFGPTNIDGRTGALTDMGQDVEVKRTNNKPKYLIPGDAHFTKDLNVNTNAPDFFQEEAAQAASITPRSPFYSRNNKESMVFSGSTTIINQENNPDKERIMQYGLEDSEYRKINGGKAPTSAYTYSATSDTLPPPISPLHPFIRMADPSVAQSIVNMSYNRYQYPISDVEHRKAFRNVFFTRPECYIVCSETDRNPYNVARQCEMDDDIRSSVMRMPHIARMLSPVYVTGTFGTNFDMDNFNYLLSNRVTGLSVDPFVLSVNESTGKSVEGYTVTPGMHMESNQGGSLTVTFRDTKYLEIFEYFRLWMIYIYKRKKGTFEPPYAGYDYANDFPSSFGELDAKKMAYYLHPYDRAIEYTCSMFDIVTNEANDRILYWMKYYGLYPTNLTVSGLNNENNGPLTSDMTVEVTFRYQYKAACTNKTLVEFNLNAGITDTVGKVTPGIKFNNSLGYINEANFTNITTSDNDVKKNTKIPYFGAGGMFVGTPYIVLGKSLRAPTDTGTGPNTIQPFLRFMGCGSGMINRVGNLGITKQLDRSKAGGKELVVGTD